MNTFEIIVIVLSGLIFFTLINIANSLATIKYKVHEIWDRIGAKSFGEIESYLHEIKKNTQKDSK